MKSYIKINYLFLIIILFSSCKQEENKEQNIDSIPKTVIEEKKPSKLVLEIDLITSTPDDIKLIANNIFINNGQFMDINLTQKLNSNESSKKITFELPENIKPDVVLGISFGRKKVKDVTIKHINMSYGDLKYSINSKEINKYFRTNKFIIYDEQSDVYKTKKVDGNHNPILFLRKPYLEKIQVVK